MTLAVTAESPKAKIDWTKPVLWLFALVLVALIILPLSWLAIYSFTDKARQPTPHRPRHLRVAICPARR